MAAVIAFTPGRLCAQTITVPTVADAGTEGVFFARLCPAHDVALADPNEADVFSIYTVKGVPYLLKLRVRPAGYVVKKGEHVVVKTTEANSLTFEHVTGQRSGIRDAADDNIVSPAADTPTADFIAANAVADGAVDVADVVETVNQIQGSPSSRFIFDAADMNKDRDVNADDVIQIVNAIMSSK